MGRHIQVFCGVHCCVVRIYAAGMSTSTCIQAVQRCHIQSQCALDELADRIIQMYSMRLLECIALSIGKAGTLNIR